MLCACEYFNYSMIKILAQYQACTEMGWTSNIKVIKSWKKIKKTYIEIIIIIIITEIFRVA